MITEKQITITEQFAESCIRHRKEDGLPGEHIPSVTALALCAEWRENKRRTEENNPPVVLVSKNVLDQIRRAKICKTCGQPRSRHHAETLQCPVIGHPFV